MLRGMYKKMTAKERRTDAEGRRAYYGISSQSGSGGRRVTDITNPNVFPRRGRGGRREREKGG